MVRRMRAMRKALIVSGFSARPRKERRAARRALTWMKGSALADDPRPVEHLVVVNYSADGAKLRTESGRRIPKEFWLEIPARRELRRARALWRGDGMLGVKFVTEKLPSGVFRADVAARLQGFEGALLEEAQDTEPASRLARVRATLRTVGRGAWRRARGYLRALRAA
jgi:hypothetical protein